MLKRIDPNTVYGEKKALMGRLRELALARRKRLGESFAGSALNTALTATAAPYVIGGYGQRVAGTTADSVEGVGVDDSEMASARLARDVTAKGLKRSNYHGRRLNAKIERWKRGPRQPRPTPEPPTKMAKLDKQLVNAGHVPPKMPKGAKPTLSTSGVLGGVGLGALAVAGKARETTLRGFRDRMRQYDAMESEPVKKPNLEAPSTASSAPATDKPKKPKAPKVEKPKAAAGKNADGTTKPIKPGAEEQPQVDPLDARVGEYQRRLSGISMVKSAGGSPAKPGAMPTSTTARESATYFLTGLVEAKKDKVASEQRMKTALRSKANLDLRQGTPVLHTFYTNDRKHLFAGNPMAMRQKIMAEHRRKNFQLKPGFENMSPIDIGTYFDELSDQGMLDRDRKALDKSLVRNTWRKTKRVSGRALRKLRNVFSGVFQAKKTPPAKAKESDSTFCNFAVGNVRYPHECDCVSCKGLLETSATSFGQNMQPGVTGNIFEITQNKTRAVEQLLRRKRGRKRRKVREAYEDLDYSHNIRRELALHGRNPEPIALARRPRTYFNTYGSLRKMDRLGMTLAGAALAVRGLMPIAQQYLFKRQPVDAARSAENVSKVFRGIPVSESKRERDPFPHVTRSSKQFQHKYPRLHAFFDSPIQTTKKAVQSVALHGARKIGLSNRYAYPASMLGATGVVAGGIYAGKKFLYDPLQKKIWRAEEILRKQREQGNDKPKRNKL